MANELKDCAHLSQSSSSQCRICLDPNCEASAMGSTSCPREPQKSKDTFGFSVVPQRSDRSLINSLVHNLLSLTKNNNSTGSSSGSEETSETEDSSARAVNPVTVVRWLYDRLSLTKDPISIIERIITDHRCLHQWVGLITDSEAAKVQDGDLEVNIYEGGS